MSTSSTALTPWEQLKVNSLGAVQAFTRKKGNLRSKIRVAGFCCAGGKRALQQMVSIPQLQTVADPIAANEVRQSHSP